MSRSLGETQKRVLRCLADFHATRSSAGAMLPLHGLKCELFGRRQARHDPRRGAADRPRLLGGPGASANLNRSLAGLVRRGLIVERLNGREVDRKHTRRAFALTVEGLAVAESLRPVARGVPVLDPHGLKPGGRVRVAGRCRMHGDRPGDGGTVLRELAAGGAPYYQVAMDGGGPAGAVAVVAADEIEPDL